MVWFPDSHIFDLREEQGTWILITCQVKTESDGRVWVMTDLIEVDRDALIITMPVAGESSCDYKETHEPYEESL